MNNNIALVLLLAMLGSCVSLPEGSKRVPRHYSLLPAQSSCSAAETTMLNFSVTRVGAGLNSDSIVQVSSHTGELVYIRDMRWASDTQELLEQRLAQDLETAGFNVTTSHHKLTNIPKLSCELRAFNLLDSGETRRSARFALSCVLDDPAQKGFRSIHAEGTEPLSQLKADSIATALSASYNTGFGQLCRALSGTP